MSIFSSVRFRLALWNVGVLAVILATFGYALRFTIQTDLLSGMDALMGQNANRAQQSLDLTGSLPPFMLQHSQSNSVVRPRLPASNPAPPLPPPYGVCVIGLNGKPIDADHPVMDNLPVQKAITGQRTYSTIVLHGVQTRILTVPIYFHQHIAFILQLARPLTQLNTELAGVTRGLLTLIPLALLIVGVGALLLTERALLPVRDIVDSTERIEAKDLSGRLIVRGQDEFSHLAVTINGMLGRLDKAFSLLQEASEKQRRFTADASHELRTPLTIIKANTSLSLSVERTPDEYRRTLSAVDRAADRMSKIVMDLLYIARSDAGEVFTMSEPVKLASILKQAVEAVSDPDEHQVFVDVLHSCWVSGDEEALVRLFANLLQNAYRYTPAHGVIVVKSEKKESLCEIRVIDKGIGIASEHLKHLGERFFRVDDARGRAAGGTGLGLAICRSIVDSHGGSIDFESVVGQGTTVIVRLPAADTPTSPRSVDASLSVKA